MEMRGSMVIFDLSWYQLERVGRILRELREGPFYDFENKLVRPKILQLL